MSPNRQGTSRQRTAPRDVLPVQHRHTTTARDAVCQSVAPGARTTGGPRMTRHHRAASVIALTLALGASAVSGAIASAGPPAYPMTNPAHSMLAAGTGPCSGSCSGGYASAGQAVAAAGKSGATLPHDPRPRSVALAGTRSVPRAAVRVVAPTRGFDWTDAGIGAGATLLLCALGLIGARAAMHTRTRHPRQQRATTS
jgi:hypothetical protein